MKITTLLLGLSVVAAALVGQNALAQVGDTAASVAGTTHGATPAVAKPNSTHSIPQSSGNAKPAAGAKPSAATVTAGGGTLTFAGAGAGAGAVK